MESRTVPVSRPLVGLIALGCLLAAVGLAFVPRSASNQTGLVLWQGGLARAGLLLGAFWLALPARNQEAPWARLSPWTIIGVPLALVLSTRIQLRILIPAALVVGLLVIILRPRPKHRPSG